MRKLSAIISDFDDTLFFSDSALKSAAKELYENLNEILSEGKKNDPDYKNLAYLEIAMNTGKIPKGLDKDYKNLIYKIANTKYFDKYLPNERLIEYLNERVSAGEELIILTARGEDMREQTETLLKRYKIRYKRLIFRTSNELKDEEFKFIEIKRLSQEYDHISLFEDKEENIKYILKNLHYDRMDVYLVRKNNLIEYQKIGSLVPAKSISI